MMDNTPAIVKIFDWDFGPEPDYAMFSYLYGFVDFCLNS